MKPFIWWAGKAWFVSRPKGSTPGWPLTVWPGTLALGYATLAEAMDATLAALAADAA